MKCDIERGQFCPTMEKYVQNNISGSVAHSKGLSTFKPMNTSTGEMRLAGVLYKSKPSDNGVVLNCCPWCKADYESALQAKAS